MEYLVTLVVEEVAKNNLLWAFIALVLLALKAAYRQRRTIVKVCGEVITSLLEIKAHWKRFKSS